MVVWENICVIIYFVTLKEARGNAGPGKYCLNREPGSQLRNSPVRIPWSDSQMRYPGLIQKLLTNQPHPGPGPGLTLWRKILSLLPWNISRKKRETSSLLSWSAIYPLTCRKILILAFKAFSNRNNLEKVVYLTQDV